MLKRSNLITVACCLLPVASFHKSVFNLVQDLSLVRLSKPIPLSGDVNVRITASPRHRVDSNPPKQPIISTSVK
ncbi:MAG: hypothetical protein F6K31_10500 [Symploca sp. SIO2G7]|nr:hypothetical protein [Symploca sp. SIO2G7]